ncbi:MAG: hypothetical protein B7Y39_18655 [Bdellovibrio sp. 28-41-41]|nr:MAG: hypothetical protein B7Y39_18655 [Bdellovibrio sp. 28-41-41]
MPNALYVIHQLKWPGGQPISMSSKWDSAVARKILTEAMQFRRISEPHTNCDIETCRECASPHLPKIISAVSKGEPVTFVLPAFPGKSPNPTKVLELVRLATFAL